MKTIKDIDYAGTGLNEHKLDVYLPDCEKAPVFIFFHGGGIEAGTKSEEAFTNPLIPLQEKGVAVVSADYRLYPDAKFPEFVEDAAMAVKWVYENIRSYIEPTGIFISGTSAGAYISELLAFDKKYLAKHGIDSDSVTGYIFDAGQPTTHFNVLRERGMNPDRIAVDESAPMYHITDGRVYPPMQIFVSDNDIPGRYEQTLLLVHTLKHFGCKDDDVEFYYMKGYSHCQYLVEMQPDGTNLFSDKAYEFIKKHTEREK